MKNKEVFEVLGKLNDIGDISGKKLVYAICKNKKILRDETEIIRAVDKPTQGFLQYQKDMQGIHAECSIEQEINGRKVKTIVKDKESEYLDRAKNLDAKNKDVIAEREVQIKEFNDFLNEECSDLKLHMVDDEFIPENISAAQMDAIISFVNE